MEAEGKNGVQQEENKVENENLEQSTKPQTEEEKKQSALLASIKEYGTNSV